MRARIVGKSSAARGWVTFPPVLLFVEPRLICPTRAHEKLWLTAQASVSFPIAAFRMDGVQPSDEAGSGLVSITVLSVTPGDLASIDFESSLGHNRSGPQAHW
jgi:hypothetical protein